MVAASVMGIGIDEEMVGVAPAVVDRLAVDFADVASGLVRSEQRWAAEYYARPLMMEGARKALEPMGVRAGGGGVGRGGGVEGVGAAGPGGPEVRPPLAGGHAPVLRDAGEDRQLPDRGVAARRQHQGHGPVGVRALRARGLVWGPRAQA